MKKEEQEQEKEKQKKQFQRMTGEPVGKLLLSLAIPTIISMMVTNIYNIVDTAFVGTLGTSESGATGIVFGFMAILQAIAFMCGQGAGSLMSRRLGEKNLEEATMYSSTGFFLSFFIGWLTAIIGATILPTMLIWLGSTKTIAPYAGTYILFILLSAPFFTSSLTMNNLLRYEGKAKLGTVGLMIGAVLNIGMDAIFMFGLDMGIEGAGMATAISQFVSFMILLLMFLTGKTQTRISIRFFTRKVATVFEVLSTGFPSLLRQGLNSVTTVLLNSCAGVYGDAAVSAMSIVSRIGFFAMAIAIGIGQGFQPICGYNYGAGKKDRVKKAYWYAMISSIVVLAVLAAPISILATPLIRKLRDDDEVIRIGVRALRLMCISQIFIPLTMMTEMGFQSTGAKLMASISSSLRSGIILIPSLIILSKLRGLSGIQEAQPVSIVIAFFVGIVFSKMFLNRLKNSNKKE